MLSVRLSRILVAVSVAGCAAVASPAVADKPSWAGQGKGEHGREAHGGGHEQEARDSDRRGADRRHFHEREVDAVRAYYGRSLQEGHCPPGLAKKRNGCLPPGQARKWAMGRPLPHGVVYYELPPQLVVELGRPPAGYRYVRVAADILLIAAGTNLVVDAIEDLGRL